MRPYLKIIIWFAAAFAGVFLWNMSPDARPLMTWLIAASLACYIVCVLVGMTVRRVMSAEQSKLHSRLDLLDRKVTALLKATLDQRRL